jgi:RNA polymerase sigma factor (sigma-70 family)
MQMPLDRNQLVQTRESLIGRLKNWADQKSWQEFYDVYSPLIYGVAVKAQLTHSEAQDVVQETTIAVAKAIGRFEYRRGTCNFKTWLHAVTKRQVANQFRKRLGRGLLLEKLPGEIEDPQFPDIPDPASHAMDEMFMKEWEQTLLDAACERVKLKVSPDQFQIYDYYALQGHGAIETARALNVSPAKVYIAKTRIGKMIREEIGRLRDEY